MAKGHNERRKNWRLRQLVNCAYGLSLCVTAPGALAAGGALPKLMFKPPTGEHHSAAQPGNHRADAFRLIFLQLEPRDLVAEAASALPVWDHRHPFNQPLLHALDRLDPEELKFEDHPLREARNGLGFDFDLPDAGCLHLNLYTNRRAGSRGLRIDMSPIDAAEERGKLWSLGATLDTARTVTGDDLVTVVPQLMLDLDGLLATGFHLQALVEYGNWQPLQQRLTTRARVAQVTVRLEF